MDLAIHRLADRTGAPQIDLGTTLVREYGITQERPAVVRVWRDSAGILTAAAKGAPETIAAMCEVRETDRAHLLADVERYASKGQRVLAVASSRIRDARVQAALGMIPLIPIFVELDSHEP